MNVIINFMYIVCLNILLIIILSLLLASLINSQWSFTKRLALGYVVLFSATAALGYIQAAIGIPIRSGIYTFLYSIAIILLLYLLRKRQSLKKIFSWDKKDTAVLVGSMLILIMILIPTYRSGGNILNPSSPIGSDMSVHFLIANLIADGGEYTYLNDSLGGDDRFFVGWIVHPQAGHYNFSVLTGGQSTKNIANLFELFTQYYIFSFLLLFVLFLHAIFDLCKPKFLTLYPIVVATAMAFIIFMAMPGTIYVQGFFSLIVSLALMIALLSFINDKQDIKDGWAWVTIIILLNGAIAASWYLISPASIIISCVAIYKSKYKNNILTYLAILLIILIPIIFTLTSFSAVGAINEPGGVHIIKDGAIIFLTASVIFIIWNYYSLKSKNLNTWLTILVICIIFSGLLGIIQIATAKQLNYYFHKSLYVPVLILSMLFVAGLVVATNKLNEHLHKVGRTLSIAASFLLLVASGLIITTTLGANAVPMLLFSSNHTSYNDTQKLKKIADENKDTRVILTNTGNAQKDYLYSRWVSFYNLNSNIEFLYQIFDRFRSESNGKKGEIIELQPQTIIKKFE